MIRNKKAISFDFEGLMGSGKTTAIKKLATNVSPQTHTLWFGTGFPYSLKRAIRDNTSIPEWITYRQQALKAIEGHTDFMFMERSSFNDFSNLCVRKKLISINDMFQLTRDWWPTFVVVIDTPFGQCMDNIKNRGDSLDIDDLYLFDQSVQQTITLLADFLGDRLRVVKDGNEAYNFVLSEIRRVYDA